MSNTSAIKLPLTADDTEQVHNPAFWRGNLYLRSLENAKAIWNRLMDACDSAGLYHREPWLELLTDVYNLKVQVATLERNGRAIAGCLFARSKKPFSRQLRSLPYSDYCRPLETIPGAGGELMDALARYSPGAWEMRGAKGMPPWQTVDCFSTWVLDLARPLSAIEKNVNEAYRRQARRARSEGVRVEHGCDADFVRRFYSMYLETRRRLGVPAQPKRLFDSAMAVFEPRKAFEVWIASHQGRDLAGLVLLMDGDHLYYKWAARLVEGPSGANHQLVWSLIEEFAGRAATLDLGRTDDRNEGLVRFKRHLGAERVPLPYAYFPKAPKNISAEVPVGAHRLVSQAWRRLPPPVARVLGGLIYSYLA